MSTRNAAPQMKKDIVKAQGLLVNGKKYSTSFLALVAVGDWPGVEELYPLQEDRFHGKWSGCPQDTETLRNLAEKRGYTVTKW